MGSVPLRALASLLALLVPQMALAQQPPSLQIESFAPVRAWATGTTVVSLTATVRNTGKTLLPAGTANARIYSLSGLDYSGGDTAPRIPELAPGAAVSFAWQLQPTTPDGALAAALTIRSADSLPQTQVLSIPHFAAPPSTDPAYVVKVPAARAGSAESVVENDRIRARIAADARGVPVLLLSAHVQSGWRQVGAVLPIAQILSGQGGQRPWWEVFKPDDVVAINGKGEAGLEVSGHVGLWWRATLNLAVKAGSSVIDLRLRVSPIRRMKLSSLRFCRFLAGEGNLGASITESYPVAPDTPSGLRAVRWADVTTGIIFQGDPPIAGWQATPAESIPGAQYVVMGGGWDGPPSPTLVDVGTMIQIEGRLFALTPSSSVRDSLRVAPPAAQAGGSRPSGR